MEGLYLFQYSEIVGNRSGKREELVWFTKIFTKRGSNEYERAGKKKRTN